MEDGELSDAETEPASEEKEDGELSDDELSDPGSDVDFSPDVFDSAAGFQ